MHRPLRALASLLAVLALPIALGGGCTPSFDFHVCFLAHTKLPGTEMAKVKTKCVAWPFAFTLGVPAPPEKDTLAIIGERNGGRYESGPTIVQDGQFEVTLEFGVDRASINADFPTRGYLRVEDDAEPQHFLEIEAAPDDTDGLTVSARNENGPTGASQHFGAIDSVRLRIVRTASDYGAYVQPQGGSFNSVGNAVSPPAAPLRCRFGTDGLAKHARVFFRSLLYDALSAGDAILSPILGDLTNAFANVQLAQAATAMSNFAGAVADLDLVLDFLDDAITRVTDGKDDGTIPKRNQPKLALAALKDARDFAASARRTADQLANATGGTTKTLKKRLAKTFRTLMLATANLAGAKTTDAKEVEKHVELRG